MAINASNQGSGFEPIAAGTFAARCYSMIQIGTVEEMFQGKPKKLHKVRISWELPTELKIFKEENGEQPHVISKEFTLSMNDKATLRKFLEGWRGKGFTDQECEKFDITVLIGKPCMLSIIHKTSNSGKIYAEISSISSVPKGMTVPDQINDSFEFSYENFSEQKLASLPQYIQDKIKSSEEYHALQNPNETQAASSDISTDDLPF